MECGLSSLVYSYKIVYRDNLYIIAKIFVSIPRKSIGKTVVKNGFSFNEIEKWCLDY